MVETNRTKDLRDRVVGSRFYDKANDECFTVIDIDTHDGKPVLALLQYDDGVAWDEAPSPDMFPPEGAEVFGLEEGGIDSERYVPMGAGPTLSQSGELCPDGSHEWNPRPDEIWPDGVPDNLPQASRARDVYNRIARCKRCGLSSDVALQYLTQDTLWFCSNCDEVYSTEVLSYSVPGSEDVPLCPECQERVNQ
jgi:hypothetical protein